MNQLVFLINKWIHNSNNSSAVLKIIYFTYDSIKNNSILSQFTVQLTVVYMLGDISANVTFKVIRTVHALSVSISRYVSF